MPHSYNRPHFQVDLLMQNQTNLVNQTYFWACDRPRAFKPSLMRKNYICEKNC
jgi:hypothetical protein